MYRKSSIFYMGIRFTPRHLARVRSPLLFNRGYISITSNLLSQSGPLLQSLQLAVSPCCQASLSGAGSAMGLGSISAWPPQLQVAFLAAMTSLYQNMVSQLLTIVVPFIKYCTEVIRAERWTADESAITSPPVSGSGNAQ